MKEKVLEARRDGHDTYITKQTKHGTFHSKVTCAVEDRDVENDLDGFTFAEIKCDIQALDRRALKFEERAFGMRHAYDVIRLSGVDVNDPVLRKLARQINIAEREAHIAKSGVIKCKNKFKTYVQACINLRRKINKEKEEKIEELEQIIETMRRT